MVKMMYTHTISIILTIQYYIGQYYLSTRVIDLWLITQTTLTEAGASQPTNRTFVRPPD
jgi:hypothetical protein